jgi:hypothetical protein
MSDDFRATATDLLRGIGAIAWYGLEPSGNPERAISRIGELLRQRDATITAEVKGESMRRRFNDMVTDAILTPDAPAY